MCLKGCEALHLRLEQPSLPEPARMFSHFSSIAKEFQFSISEDESRFVLRLGGGGKRNLNLATHVEFTPQPFEDIFCSPKLFPCHIQTGLEEDNCASHLLILAGELRMLDAYLL